MLVFDAVIYNEDRHFGNFGVLRDNHSGALLGAAPVFDNRLSLFNFAIPEDWADLDSYAKTWGTACGISFENICREVMGPVQARQLRGLIGFTFQRHPRLSLPEERLTAIERHVQKRVRQLLELTPIREKAKNALGGSGDKRTCSSKQKKPPVAMPGNQRATSDSSPP